MWVRAKVSQQYNCFIKLNNHSEDNEIQMNQWGILY